MSDYTKYNDPWADADSATGGGDESTPIPAAALDHIEAGIDTAHSELQAHLDDTSDAHDASAISIADAAGDFTATDVEGALAEIQTDIEAMSAAANPWQVVFTALANEPPAAAYATLDTRNSHAVLDFDAGTDESAVFRGVLPTGYGGGGINVKLIWAATSATAGDVIWNVSIERINAGAMDIDADSFATAVTATAAADSVSGETTETTLAFSNGAAMDSLAAGEMFRLKVLRDADNGSDTMTGDAELLAVVVTEQ